MNYHSTENPESSGDQSIADKKKIKLTKRLINQHFQQNYDISTVISSLKFMAKLETHHSPNGNLVTSY